VSELHRFTAPREPSGAPKPSPAGEDKGEAA
jgi:hypothetical protein